MCLTNSNCLSLKISKSNFLYRSFDPVFLGAPYNAFSNSEFGLKSQKFNTLSISFWDDYKILYNLKLKFYFKIDSFFE